LVVLTTPDDQRWPPSSARQLFARSLTSQITINTLDHERMNDIARNGNDFTVSTNGQDWRVAWYPPPDPPPGTPHGATAVCITSDRIVLVSSDGQRWGLPGGRPQPGERWADTLRREVGEEACAQVTSSRLLGFTRGVCVRGRQEGLALVRSLWRAEVRLERWEPRFEMAHRRLVPAEEAVQSVTIAEGAWARSIAACSWRQHHSHPRIPTTG
jgi:ADP-ribose pyrophosphatase YjhB (NUDIX family)